MKHSIWKIGMLALLWIAAAVSSEMAAQTRVTVQWQVRQSKRVPRGATAYNLGAGGSQYSRRTDRQIMRNNGLRTGQYTGAHYLIGAYVDGGYSLFTNNMPNVSYGAKNGFGSFGLAFDYQNYRFMLHTGIGLRYQFVSNTFPNERYMAYGVADTWAEVYGDAYCDVQYDFTNRSDMARTWYAQIPLLFGLHTPAHAGSFYQLYGVKLQYGFWNKTLTSAIGNTQAVYERYEGVFTEMDNHGMRKDVEINNTSASLPLKFDLLASMELGYEWANPAVRGYRVETVSDWRLRVGLFCDYGILNIMPGGNKPSFEVPEEMPYDFCTFHFTHPFATDKANGYWLRNLFAGIRFTALIGYKDKEKCIMCFSYRDESDINTYHRGGR